MPILASILASVALIISGWMYVQPDKAPSLGASQTISSLTSYTPAIDADVMPIVDTSGGITKKITWANVKASLKTYQDTLYSPIFSTSAGLAGLLSDETGSAGGFVRATGPTISGAALTSSPTLTTPVINVGSDVTGDIYYRNSGGVFTRLGVGSNNQILGISSGLPSYFATSSSALGILPPQAGNGSKFLTTDATSLSWGNAAASSDYFSTTTTGVWTKPSSVHASSTVFVECWGGGGGGGGTTGGSAARSGGGGGGAYVYRIFKASDLTSTVAITVGAGGPGGAAGTNNGTAGGNTTFGSYLTAYGGGGGGYGNGAGSDGSAGAGGGWLNAGTSGANGGAVTLGGGPGAQTTNGSDGAGGGFGSAFGGSTCGDSMYGGAGGTHGANGCNSVYGGGGGAGGDAGGHTGGTSIYGGAGGTGGDQVNGGNGTVPGGGGGGTRNNGSNQAGGNGAGGKCNVVTQN